MSSLRQALLASMLVTAVPASAQTLTLKVPLGHSGEITCAAFSADSRTFVSGSQDKTLILWDVQSGKELITFRGHRDQVNGVAFSPDGSMLASAGGSKYINFGEVKLWNAVTGDEIRSLRLKRQGWSVAFSPDGEQFAAGMSTGKIIVWDVASGKTVQSLRTKGEDKDWDITIDSIRFDGDQLVTRTNEGLRELWNLRSGKRFRAENPGDYSRSADDLPMLDITSPNGRYTVNKAHPYYVLELWDSTGDAKVLTGHSRPVSSVAYSPTGTYIVSQSPDPIFPDNSITTVWDLTSGRARGFRRSSPYQYDWNYPLAGVAVSQHGRHIITAWQDHLVQWDAHTGEVIKTFETDSQDVTALAYSPTGFFVGCGTSDGDIWIWEAYTGKFAFRFGSSGNVTSLAFSPDETYVITGHDEGEVYLWSLYDSAASKLYREHDGLVSSVTFSSNGFEIISASHDGSVWGYTRIRNYEQVNSIAVSPDSSGNYWAIGTSDGSVDLVDWHSGKFVQTLKDYSDKVNSVAFSPDGRFVIAGSEDGTIRILETQTGHEVAKLIVLDSTEWVVISPSGLFDASSGAMALMHFTYGLEVIALDQLKERYYEPGLLSKIMGFNPEKPREADRMSQVELYPSITASVDGNLRLTIHLTDRGGGFGVTPVSLNGTEIIADARPLGASNSDGSMTIPIDLQAFRSYVVAGDNVVTVSTFNSAHYLRSPPVQAHFDARDIASKDPQLWLVAIGVADYAGDQIDLTFPARDARAMELALEQGARNLFNVFGSEMTHSYLLTTDQTELHRQPSQENILGTFERIADSARASDVLVVYLSGHGINWGGQDGDFYYLTQEAYTANVEAYNDPLVRENSAISSEALVTLINKIPAQKRVLMIDACGSGRAVENLMEKRSISSTTVRALDRMRERTGTHVISGCAADAVSYEASRFGQGIMTYALLEGMKGAALRDNEFVDVDLLFQKARDRVPELARDIGGIQQPLVFSPSSTGSFDIGKLTERDREQIQLNPVKPIFVMSSLLDLDAARDALGISGLLDKALAEIAARGQRASIVFVNARDFPEGCKVTGFYRSAGSTITGQVVLTCGEQAARTELSAATKEELVKAILEWVATAGRE
jgi:WD40 repeat protein/uncharacterized caspase-like protein